jgi:TP901 family phage tail tape measure protein
MPKEAVIAGSSLIGNLAVTLGLNTAAFEKGATLAEKQAQKLGRRLQSIGDGMSDIGQKMALGITAPLLGIGAVGVKMAGNFETAMNQVGISSQATGEQMKRMNDLALDIGKSTLFGASEAAGAMDMLAKTGLNAEQILGGAAKATTDLAAAAGSELEPASSAISDAMQQFGLSTKDLPTIVNQVTGAVNESKLSFEDFVGAAGQAGGVAGALGVSFQDFNAVLAGTSSLFGSGSDAGTSLKTFLTTLVGKSSTARGKMQELGLSFYDSAGKMKSMSEIAQHLQDRLGHLSEQQLTEAASIVFGNDAMRTAIGLMRLGGKGVDELKAKIANTNASEQAAKMMSGFNGQMDQLKGALETLAIRVAQTGLLNMLTDFVKRATDFVDRLATASPEALKFAVAVAAIAAAVGPLLMAFGPVVGIIGAAVPKIAALKGGLAAAAIEAGGVAPLLAPLIPVIAGLAAAALAGYAAWKNWDKIQPVLQQWGAGAQKIIGGVDGYLKGLSERAAELDKKLGIPPPSAYSDGLNAQFKTIAAADPLGEWARKADAALLPLVTADPIGTWLRKTDAALKPFITADPIGPWARRVDAALSGMAAAGIAAVQRLYTGIATWMGSKLSAVWEGAQKKIEQVKTSFYNLYDAVVGHSYVPDMIEGIAAEMGRLDAIMVVPAKKATTDTTQAFRGAAASIQATLDRLFPEFERLKTFAADTANIAASNLSPEMKTEARRRLAHQSAGTDHENPLGNIERVSNDKIGDLESEYQRAVTAMQTRFALPVKRSNMEVAESFVYMAEGAVESLRRMADAFKSGGFWDKIQGVLGLIGTGVRAYLDIKGAKGGSSGFGGFRAMGGPTVPGKSYIVGENGPEWFTPGARGFVTPNNDNSRGGIAHIVPSPYFDVVVRNHASAVAAPMAGQAAVQGSSMAQREIARRHARQIP